MTDTSVVPGAGDAPLRSVVAPSGGAGAGPEAEAEAGTAMAETNAKNQEEALDKRSRETLNARQIVSDRIAATDKEQAERAEQVKGMIKDRLPPPGPGLPQVDVVVVAATMDPNNEVLNPDMSKLGHRQNLPPGARVPAPVLPQDTIQTQFASKPPTEEHAKEGEEVSKGLVEPIYPPAGSQPTVELTPEEEEKYGQGRGGGQGSQRQLEQQSNMTNPQATQYPADPAFDPRVQQQPPQR